uniref:FGE-sulfatase domain-containing protein n=1 Tax=Heterorhabditis bacteriophora TaxID=37862 RepID=A0A1I7XEX4_HETBA
MVQWVDQRVDYDPFLTAPQPSNPWITDDTNLWALNTDTFALACYQQHNSKERVDWDGVISYLTWE